MNRSLWNQSELVREKRKKDKDEDKITKRITEKTTNSERETKTDRQQAGQEERLRNLYYIFRVSVLGLYANLCII